MNKAEVVRRVAERSGVSHEVCESVIGALEKVLQEELGARGGAGMLAKIGEFLQYFSSGDSK